MANAAEKKFSPLDAEIQKRVERWLSWPIDEASKQPIRDLAAKNAQELANAFYTDLSFGTGGMRAIMGVGSNRMNRYTVQMATQGLANYLLKQSEKKGALRVFIGYDSRNHSRLFAEDAARVLAANQIHVSLCKEMRPTPYVSFAARYKKCIAAIMITASHNPAEYNGYKVYGSDGGQVVFPHDEAIMQEVHHIRDLSEVRLVDLNSPLIEMEGEKLDEAYLAAIRPLSLYPEENKARGKELKITYTSLHGTGITLAPKALKNWGFSSIDYVEKQIIADGNFPTVKFPNPEYKEALAMGTEQLEKTGADLLIANDPDADRMGIAVLQKGKAAILTGNQIASLCVEYLCETLTRRGKMPKNGAFVTTIVSTDLIKTIANFYGASCFEVLTGFKYIGEKIHQWESSPTSPHFIFGAEESYGFLLGTHARDKDAIVSSCLIAEIALMNKKEGKTLLDRMEAIYQKHGLFRERQLALTFSAGREGKEAMDTLMHSLRKKLPETLCGQEVMIIEDYLNQKRYLKETKSIEPLFLPQSDVLLFRLKDHAKIVIRPSGTEPKVKIYAEVQLQKFPSVEKGIAQCDQHLDELLNAMRKDLLV